MLGKIEMRLAIPEDFKLEMAPEMSLSKAPSTL